jgi:hypothetical protein
MAYNPNNPNGQATSANSAPVVIASDQSDLPVNIDQVGAVAVAATAKSTQATNFFPTQDAKDSGRTYMTFYIDAIAGVTTEALVTMNINTGGTVTTGTSYTVPAGKKLRLQAISGSVRTTNTTNQSGRIRVRSAVAVAASSGIVMDIVIPGLTGTNAAGVGNLANYTVPDGIEIAAGQQIGISQIISAVASTVSCIVTGFLY